MTFDMGEALDQARADLCAIRDLLGFNGSVSSGTLLARLEESMGLAPGDTPITPLLVQLAELRAEASRQAADAELALTLTESQNATIDRLHKRIAELEEAAQYPPPVMPVNKSTMNDAARYWHGVGHDTGAASVLRAAMTCCPERAGDIAVAAIQSVAGQGRGNVAQVRERQS